MKLNKSNAATLLYLLGGDKTAAAVHEHLPDVDIRSIQRALARLMDAGVVRRTGPVNDPEYAISYEQLLKLTVSDQALGYEDRPASRFNHELIDWLIAHVSDDAMPQIVGIQQLQGPSDSQHMLSARDLEYLTVELSWKSSALEDNTYTLLDTQLLLLEGVKAPNRTTFEIQMVLNHKDAIKFIVEHPELFRRDISFAAVEELHRIISYNLGIATGTRHRLVASGRATTCRWRIRSNFGRASSAS